MQSFGEDDFESKLESIKRATHSAYGRLLELETKNEILDPLGPVKDIVTDFSYLDKRAEFELKVDRKLDTELRCTYFSYINSCFATMTGRGL